MILSFFVEQENPISFPDRLYFFFSDEMKGEIHGVFVIMGVNGFNNAGFLD